MPIFLVNVEWFHSFSCLLFIDIFLIGCFALFLITTSKYDNKKIEGKQTIILVNILTIVFVNTAYLLTLGLNPGVRNLATIDDDQYEE